MIKKRKWLYFVFGILMLMVMPGFEDNKIQAQTSVGELLIAENKLEGGVTERIYVITNDEISENTRSVSARKATKKYTYEVNGEAPEPRRAPWWWLRFSCSALTSS